MLKIKQLKNLTILFLVSTFLLAPIFVFTSPVNANQIDDEIARLQEEISAKQGQMEKYEDQENEYKKMIRKNQSSQATLKSQMAVLTSGISKTETQIKSTQIDIDKTNLEIKKVSLEIGRAENEINQKKEYMASLLRLIAQSDDKSQLEIILTNSSISEFLDQIEYVKNLNSNLNEILSEVKKVKQELEEQNKSLESKKEQLKELRKKLEEQKAAIVDQRVNKKYILDKTKQSEREYQNLLSKAKAEQSAANASIVAAEQAIRAKLLEKNGKSALTFNDKGFVWPVTKNFITAYFHDPDYPYKHIFQHPAIDIRAGQGSVVRAAASGYVAKAKNNGYGYSYIMIVHGGGLSTVYGHVSRIDVKVDQFVAQGQVIGASGGTPGTKGAGYLTTGPHMHFETRLNGIPVNPLNYLP